MPVIEGESQCFRVKTDDIRESSCAGACILGGDLRRANANHYPVPARIHRQCRQKRYFSRSTRFRNFHSKQEVHYPIAAVCDMEHMAFTSIAANFFRIGSLVHKHCERAARWADCRPVLWKRPRLLWKAILAKRRVLGLDMNPLSVVHGKNQVRFAWCSIQRT